MTPQEEIQVRQMMANYYTGGTPDYSISSPRAPSETMAEYYRRMGINPGRPMDGSPPINPYPPGFGAAGDPIVYGAMDEARARPFNPDDSYAGGSRFFDGSAPYNPNYGIRPPETMAEYYRRMGINPGRPMDGSPPMLPPGFDVRPPPPINPYPPGFDPGTPPPEENAEIARTHSAIWEDYIRRRDGPTNQAEIADRLERLRALNAASPFTPYTPPPIPPMGEVAADPEPEEYDGFVDSGTGQRGYLDFKYMPTPMDTSVAMAQAAPVAMAQAAPPVANTAYNAPPVANTAYNAPPVANTAYMPPPTDAPVNTAYMPSRRTVPVDTTYRPPASANTTYMPSPSPTYGMSTTPTYNMSNAQTTTPSYGGQIREPSYSPNQAGKYKVDSPRLKNTGGLFNDLNAFFGRPQT